MGRAFPEVAVFPGTGRGKQWGSRFPAVEKLIGSEAFPNGSAIELKDPRKLDAAGRLLAESGYAGQPVTCMAAQDLPHHNAWHDVTVDFLTRLGIMSTLDDAG